MLQFTANKQLSSAFAKFKGKTVEESDSTTLPQRMEGKEYQNGN
jgi:hypothetical protein